MSDASSGQSNRATRADWVVLGLLGISLSVNVLLGLAFVQLTARLVQAPPGAPSGPAIGSTVPPLDVHNLTGAREQVGYSADQRATAIYVFTPECIWCKRNLANIRALIAADGQRYRVIGLSLSPDVDKYLKEAKLDFPVYTRPSSETVAAYGLGTTPHTLVISPDGKVVKRWSGAYTGATKKEVEEFFGVKLPGLEMVTTAANQPSPVRKE